jgi:hypothetical protein
MPYVVCRDCDLRTDRTKLDRSQAGCPRCGSQRLLPAVGARFQSEFATHGFKRPRMIIRQARTAPPAA